MKRLWCYFSKTERGLWSCSVVLIVLWVLASVVDSRYVSVVVCFAAFLANDLYGYVSWRRMETRQSNPNRD